MSRTAITWPTSDHTALTVGRPRPRSSNPSSSICNQAVSTRTEITVAAAAISTQSTRGRVNTMSRSISGWAHRRWPTKLMSTRNSSTTTNTKAATKVPTTTVAGGPNVRGGASDAPTRTFRSEEHTSELQSRGHLVCRLLLEKKKDEVAK